MASQSQKNKREERLAHIKSTVRGGPALALAKDKNENENEVKVEAKEPEKTKEELVVENEEIKTSSPLAEDVPVTPVIKKAKEVKEVEEVEEVKQAPKKQQPKNKPEAVEEGNNADTKNNLLQELKAKGKKKRIEDTHTRCTYLVRNDLEKRVNDYAVGNFGFKTSFINYAIEAALEDYDKIYNEEEDDDA